MCIYIYEYKNHKKKTHFFRKKSNQNFIRNLNQTALTLKGFVRFNTLKKRGQFIKREKDLYFYFLFRLCF